MKKGRYGIHGGQYIPETLMNAVNELEEAYEYYKNDRQFNEELTTLLNEYAGRPSRLYYAERMTGDLGGARIYLKREDLNHTGSAGEENGKNPRDRGDRGGTARRGDRNCSGSNGDGVRSLYGGGGYEASGTERVPDAPPRSEGPCCDDRYGNAQGCSL